MKEKWFLKWQFKGVLFLKQFLGDLQFLASAAIQGTEPAQMSGADLYLLFLTIEENIHGVYLWGLMLASIRN